MRSNKSILGIGSDARLLGVGLVIGTTATIGQIRNVIIRNITFEKARAPIDGVAVSYGATNVWIDHCNFLSDREHGVDFYDGLLDITNGADFVTVSWCRFSDHYKTSLVGSSDGADAATPATSRSPTTTTRSSTPAAATRACASASSTCSTTTTGTSTTTAIASRMDAEVVIENNWFENVTRPIRADTSLSPVAGRVRGTDTNVFLNCTRQQHHAAGRHLGAAVRLPARSRERRPGDRGAMVRRGRGDVLPARRRRRRAPIITVQPVSQTIEAGATVTFSVLVDGTWPFTYTWLKDGVVIAGATGPELKLVNVQAADIGSYTAVIENAAGTVTTAPATLGLYDDQNGGLPGVFLSRSVHRRHAHQSGAARVGRLVHLVGFLQPDRSGRADGAHLHAAGGVVEPHAAGLLHGFRQGRHACGWPEPDARLHLPALGIRRRRPRPTDTTFYVGLLRSVPNPGGRVAVDFGSNSKCVVHELHRVRGVHQRQGPERGRADQVLRKDEARVRRFSEALGHSMNCRAVRRRRRWRWPSTRRTAARCVSSEPGTS